MNWYYFKNKKVQGYCPAKSKLEVAKFAGYSDIVIQRVIFNGEEFEKVSDNAERRRG